MLALDSLAEERWFFTCPISFSNGVETTDLLATGIIFDESHFTRNVDLALFFSDLLLFLGERLWTEATAVANDMFRVTEKGGMAM